MDYAATFCEYSGPDGAALSTTARPASKFPPAMSAGTVLLISAALQIAVLAVIFLFSLDKIEDFRNPSTCFLAAGALSLAISLYWLASGMFTPPGTINTDAREVPFTVIFASLVGTCLAVSLFCFWQHASVQNATAGTIIICVSTLLVAAGSAPFTRLLLRHAVRRQRLACDIVLAGSPSAMRDFIRHMREHHASVRICAAFDLEGNGQAREIEDVPLRNGIAELLGFHARHPKPRVVLLPRFQEEPSAAHLELLHLQPMHVLTWHQDLSYDDHGSAICHAGVPGARLQLLQRPPLSAATFFTKDMFDRAAGIAALLLFAPVMLACALAIKLTSPGPVLYRQKRIGYRNNIFHVYKFRSMHMTDCDKITLTKRGDDRIFPFGRIMRRLSLDELPQLFNVIRGEMSLVGPRPHMREARAGSRLYYDVVADYGSRHRVKPGITGWAQINGWRGPTDTEESIRARVEYDLYYIDNWSFWFDLKILFRTVAGGFAGKNAV